MRKRQTEKLRVALVHYWLTTWGGGERVLRALADLFPQADIYAVVANDAIASRFADHKLRTSFIQQLPGSLRWHRHFLPLYPLALEQFDLRDYDLVISSDAGPAHGVLTSASTCHISYCHSPMRYLWDFYHEYRNGREIGTVSRYIFDAVAHYLRMWDVTSAARVDFFAANSHNVAARIHKHYRRTSTVVYPPVDTSAADTSTTSGDHYLFVGRLVDYKRADLAVEACTRMHRRLRVVGTGPQVWRLQGKAGPTIEFLGELSDEGLRNEYASCRALLFPGEEDFGIVPVEAQAHGKPVIAFGRGGVRESIAGVWSGRPVLSEEHTGIFFAEQTSHSLVDAIRHFERNELRFSPVLANAQAQKFSRERFESAMLELIEQSLESHSTWLYDNGGPAAKRDLLPVDAADRGRENLP